MPQRGALGTISGRAAGVRPGPRRHDSFDALRYQSGAAGINVIGPTGDQDRPAAHPSRSPPVRLGSCHGTDRPSRAGGDDPRRSARIGIGVRKPSRRRPPLNSVSLFWARPTHSRARLTLLSHNAADRSGSSCLCSIRRGQMSRSHLTAYDFPSRTSLATGAGGYACPPSELR